MGSSSSIKNWPAGPIDRDTFKAISGNHYHADLFETFSRNGVIDRATAEKIVLVVQYIHITKFDKIYDLFGIVLVIIATLFLI